MNLKNIHCDEADLNQQNKQALEDVDNNASVNNQGRDCPGNPSLEKEIQGEWDSFFSAPPTWKYIETNKTLCLDGDWTYDEDLRYFFKNTLLQYDEKFSRKSDVYISMFEKAENIYLGPDFIGSYHIYIDWCEKNIYVSAKNKKYRSQGDLLLSGDCHTLLLCNSNVSSVIIPDSVTEIDDCAFYNCHTLKNIYIPDSVTKIEDYTFGDCEDLEEVSVSHSCKIADRAFSSNCSTKLIRR